MTNHVASYLGENVFNGEISGNKKRQMKINWRNGAFMLLMAALSACSTQAEKKMDLNPADMDLSIAPGADFDEYANGGWKKNNPMPAEKSRYGSFDKLIDQAELQLKDIFSELELKSSAEGSMERKIADFYRSGMDTLAIEQAGMSPVEGLLAEIDAIGSTDEMIEKIGEWSTTRDNPFFGFGTGADMKNSDMQILYFGQSGISMPDRDYYLKTDEKSKEIQAKYRNFVSGIFQLAGNDSATSGAFAEKIYAIEYHFAEIQMSLIDRRDPFKTYNRMNIDSLKILAPNMKWDIFFEKSRIGNIGEFVVGQPDFFKQLDAHLLNTSVEDWKIYLKYNALTGLTSYGPKAWSDLSFEFYGKTLKGQQAERPRWKRIQSTTNAYLGEAIGQIYVAKYFPEEAKERMILLIENLRKSLANRIANLEWMSAETKEKAQEKLAAIIVKVGYPDEWKDYSKMDVVADSYAQNILNAVKFNYDDMLSEINQPVDKKEWHMTPQMVNAYYNPTVNEIVFPAAILQPPFFYMNGDDAINYGAIGVVIGHEITHGFDDRGRLYDLKGNLNDWWTAADAEKFTTKADVLVNQFNKYVVSVENNDTIYANGKLTLGENIADLGGLYIAYDALQMSLKGDEPLIDDFTPAQRFYIAYARLWAANMREAEKIRLTNIDEHSLGRNRINGALKNIPSFYEAFQVKDGDAMWLPEGERAVIW